MVAGVDKLTPTAEKMRRLMHYGQILQSHALHFFHLASPDLLFGFDAPPMQRNVVGLALAYPDLAKRAILLRKYGQEVIKAVGGKKVHPTGRHPRRRQQEPVDGRARQPAERHRTDHRLVYRLRGAGQEDCQGRLAAAHRVCQLPVQLREHRPRGRGHGSV